MVGRTRDQHPDNTHDPDNILPYHDDGSDTDDTVNNEETGTFIIRPGDDESPGIDDELVVNRRKNPILQYIPTRVQRVWHVVAEWTKGPNPPRIYSIRPFYPEVQEFPPALLERYFPKRAHKVWLLIGYYFVWLLCFAIVLNRSAFSAEIPGYGSPVTLNCGARYWSKGNICGINGDSCRPFNNVIVPFRCPANCKRVELMEPYAVGGESYNYRPLVVGGPTERDDLSSTIYRGDSFICGSAIHAGFIDNMRGGCGVLKLIGQKKNYPSTKAHGITSIPFDSYFPQSFSFVPGTSAQCLDLRWPLLAISVVFSAILSLFVTSPPVFFWTIFTALFFHVALVSDPPSLTNYHSLISLALGRFLPAAFCAAVIYKTAVKRTLTNLTAQIEKTILWLGPCWVGALNNYTFDKIPIQRLTPHDIQQQPGAIPALIIVVLSIFTIALGQAYAFRVEGRMRKYLAIYALFVGSLLLLVAVPGMNVRIHHYILALLLLPGTCFQNRPSLVYQGLLVGLFLNGIARWGFDSILQTPDDLRGDGQLGSLLPHILPPIINNNFDIPSLAPNITFEFPDPLPRNKGYDGISVLVNDVERWRRYEEGGVTESFTWVRAMGDVPEYFRFAYMRGRGTGDYTKAGTWGVEGGWKEGGRGPSRA
ncbi:hypothetical protein K402DRAFT_364823 [Aulographum hederae CBS 113979]|uniref:LCCL domain-containing protein n=1 Tax=Aulographum hederae CBS 113979 TaxID=1176131 RepID=A0A6G1GKV8_9PEZI|nr:hypothetical protein K402DRAFT_364823 [Aulographum hederae CBS 113979]